MQGPDPARCTIQLAPAYHWASPKTTWSNSEELNLDRSKQETQGASLYLQKHLNFNHLPLAMMDSLIWNLLNQDWEPS